MIIGANNFKIFSDILFRILTFEVGVQTLIQALRNTAVSPKETMIMRQNVRCKIFHRKDFPYFKGSRFKYLAMV